MANSSGSSITSGAYKIRIMPSMILAAYSLFSLIAVANGMSFTAHLDPTVKLATILLIGVDGLLAAGAGYLLYRTYSVRNAGIALFWSVVHMIFMHNILTAITFSIALFIFRDAGRVNRAA